MILTVTENAESSTAASTVTAEKNVSQKKRVVFRIAATALAAAILGLIVYTLLPGRKAEKAIEIFMTALSENDPSALDGLFSPAMLEYGRYEKDGMEETLRSGLASMRAPLVSRFGENFALTWKITGEDPVSREVLIEINSKLESKRVDPISEEKYVNVELTIEGNGTSSKEEMRFLASREGKHWYIFSFAN